MLGKKIIDVSHLNGTFTKKTLILLNDVETTKSMLCKNLQPRCCAVDDQLSNKFIQKCIYSELLLPTCFPTYLLIMLTLSHPLKQP